MKPRKQREKQRAKRRRRNERAFIFDKELSCCLAEVDREDWEFAVSMENGDVAAAARLCGALDVPRGGKALWGTSAEDALATYRRWQKRRQT